MGTQIITAKFIERMRSSDYQNTSYAFAELIDNSFDAGASIVDIICIEKRDRHGKRFIDEILFCDDGIGMDNSTLNNCLTFAYGTNEDLDHSITNKKIGKFGMGLPNSSISQCRLIKVYSKTETSEWRSKVMDIDKLVRHLKFLYILRTLKQY
jgi:HSP90 family molecular chaperone